MSFLGIEGKTYVVFGVANRKSLAYFVGMTLEKEGAKVIYVVRNEKRRKELEGILSGRELLTCDMEDKGQIEALGKVVLERYGEAGIDGFVHSIAFANYSEGFKAFHETKREDFLQAVTISCFSLVEIANALKGSLKEDGSVVATGISSQVLAENYGYMSPIKAGLDSATRFLAKSFSKDTRVRFNTVNSGPLKTSASAGIPGYLENYLYAEKMMLRKEALKTQEVADVVVYLLSGRSSGINAQNVVVNGGMDLNYFDKELVDGVMKR